MREVEGHDGERVRPIALLAPLLRGPADLSRVGCEYVRVPLAELSERSLPGARRHRRSRRPSEPSRQRPVAGELRENPAETVGVGRAEHAGASMVDELGRSALADGHHG